jgi:protein involved in polysaccharide export with SLBB domain
MGSDYVLGSGDQVALTTFGSLALAQVLTVDRGGKVAIPEVGLADVRGLTLEGARAAVRSMLARRHAGVEQFNLEVVGLHDVQVFIIGEVPRPGSYLVPSSSSAVTLLGQAGGPGAQGTWRGVQHLRGGKLLRTLDLYALRFEGTGLQGPGFQDGDCLFVPLAGRRILVKGAFRRTPDAPGVLMELKDGEGALDAVRFAGGLVASASRILLTVQRTSPEGITSVADLPNEPSALRAAGLYDADVLAALHQRERADEFVEVAGAVAVPGRFAFRPGMRVLDLLTLASPGDQVLPRTYRARAELLRTFPDGSTRLLAFDLEGALRGDLDQDLPLQVRDRVELTDLAALRPPRKVTILGPLSRPGTYDWHEGMRASDLLFKAGVPELWASKHEAELARFREGGTGEVRRLDLARLLATEARAPVRLGDETVNPRLNPFDQITVYEDPAFRMHPTVQVTGQVLRPGPYVLTAESCTLRQLIIRAGGLTPEAMPSGGVFLRAHVTPSESGDARAEGEAATAINEILQRLNETRRGRDAGALEPNPLLHGLLAGDLNRMVVDFPAALGGDARQDVTLVDGDRLHLPRRTDSVYVVGEVASAFSSFHVKPGDRVKDVLGLAGGYTRNADVAQVRLLKASGRIVDSSVTRADMEPGDALLVPQRIRKDVPWQDSLLAMTPLAILYNALRR